MAMPYAPDWVTRLSPPPPAGVPAAIEAFSGRSQFWTPKQLGPAIRTPPARAAAIISSCSRAPSGPTSAKPPLMTTAAGTPLAAASRITWGTAAAGTTITARSTSPGTSARVG